MEIDITEKLQGVELSRWFNNKENRKIRREEYIKWIANAKVWTSFNTLTVDTKKLDRFKIPQISQESLEKKIHQFFRMLNKNLIGKKKYWEVCGKNYFSYVYAIEPHKSGNLHAHFMADAPLNNELIAVIWDQLAGFSSCKKIDDLEGAIEYTTKDIIKGGYVDQYFRKDEFIPLIKPDWWI